MAQINFRNNFRQLNATDERIFEFLFLFLANNLGKTCARTTDVEKALIDWRKSAGLLTFHWRFGGAVPKNCAECSAGAKLPAFTHD
jgi:hypothetical protein